MPKSWECNPTNTPTHPEMWGLDRPSNWRMRSAELVWIGANVTQALNTKKPMVVTKHFYPNEDGGRQNFFYQIMWGYFDEDKGEFHTRVHPQGIWSNSNGQEIVHIGQRVSNAIHHWCHCSQSWHLSINYGIGVNSKHRSHIKIEWTQGTTFYTNKLHKNLYWLMTNLTQLKNLHLHILVTHIIHDQICDGVQEFQQEMDLPLLAFHLMCKIPFVLTQAHHLTPLWLI
jgi:hypothetical protein